MLIAAVLIALITSALALLFWRRSARVKTGMNDYRRRCLAYERGLGLPFWSRSETELAIWARAAAGDEEAWEILSALQGGDPPLLLD